MSDPAKKLIIDDDWKQEAQAEKEALEAKLEQEKERLKQPVPRASFEVLVNSLAMPAMLNLGMVQMPGHEPNMQEAKFYIDLLEVLENKTKGNLETQEHNILKALLHELRMAFVAISNAQTNKPAN
ncbi:MAG TPA: DUF1844 domain-containing protein [Gemmatales bacterium]|nr:DUF1844 domain-containing protein [Gemmatales bacterium]HMP17008.1 DUF1844 domain-containing protein [Gemmatales bacterium]